MKYRTAVVVCAATGIAVALVCVTLIEIPWVNSLFIGALASLLVSTLGGLSISS